MNISEVDWEAKLTESVDNDAQGQVARALECYVTLDSKLATANQDESSSSSKLRIVKLLGAIRKRIWILRSDSSARLTQSDAEHLRYLARDLAIHQGNPDGPYKGSPDIKASEPVTGGGLKPPPPPPSTTNPEARHALPGPALLQRSSSIALTPALFSLPPPPPATPPTPTTRALPPRPHLLVGPVGDTAACAAAWCELRREVTAAMQRCDGGEPPARDGELLATLVQRLRFMRESLISAYVTDKRAIEVFEASCEVCVLANDAAETLKCLQGLTTSLYPRRWLQQGSPAHACDGNPESALPTRRRGDDDKGRNRSAGNTESVSSYLPLGFARDSENPNPKDAMRGGGKSELDRLGRLNSETSISPPDHRSVNCSNAASLIATCDELATRLERQVQMRPSPGDDGSPVVAGKDRGHGERDTWHGLRGSEGTIPLDSVEGREGQGYQHQGARNSESQGSGPPTPSLSPSTATGGDEGDANWPEPPAGRRNREPEFAAAYVLFFLADYVYGGGGGGRGGSEKNRLGRASLAAVLRSSAVLRHIRSAEVQYSFQVAAAAAAGDLRRCIKAAAAAPTVLLQRISGRCLRTFQLRILSGLTVACRQVSCRTAEALLTSLPAGCGNDVSESGSGYKREGEDITPVVAFIDRLLTELEASGSARAGKARAKLKEQPSGMPDSLLQFR